MWEADCRASLDSYTDWPVLTLNVPWELNVIKWMYYYTSVSEFIFLQDTVVVKDHEWIREAFDHPGSVSLCTKPFYMYLGKYTSDDLDAFPHSPHFPVVANKRDAVTHEGEWTSIYNRGCKNVKYLWSDWHDWDPNVFVERHGRLNMYYENDHIIKYKGTWSPEMVPDA